jgi:hypothetical protein
MTKVSQTTRKMTTLLFPASQIRTLTERADRYIFISNAIVDAIVDALYSTEFDPSDEFFQIEISAVNGDTAGA